MERGRSTGVGGGGGARGLVAGVRKVFRSKSCSEKHSRSRTVREDEAPDQAPGSRATHPPTRNSNSSSSSSNNTTTKHRRCPRSPFLGWRRSKSHKDISESQKKAKGRDALENERAGWCSQSQAERLSLHSSETYGHITLAAQQDVGTGRCGDSERSRAQSDNKNGTTTNEDESGSDCGEYTEPRLCNGTTVCSDGNGAVGHGGEPCAKTSDGVKDHANNSVINSFVCNSDNVVVGSESSCVSLPESGSGGQPRGVVRDRGDGSDSLEVCGEEETLEKETCVRYLKDIYRNSKETSDCPTSFSGGPAMLGRGLWLKAALSYNLQMPDSPRNEVVVLALGIDQYIEEVFRHLDPSGTSRVNAEDLEALCQVLRLTEAMKEEEEEEVERCRCLGSNLTLHGSLDGSLADINQYSKCPLHLTFSDFNDKLCARFIRAAKAESVLPLGLRRPNNQRLVTSVVNVQRRYDVLENISRSLAEVNAKLNDKEGTRLLDDCTTTGVVCCKCQQVTHVDRNSNISPQPLDVEVSYLQRQVLLQEQELQCLREVIEDMRIALQSSDAENLALHVRIERGDVTPNPRASQHDLSLTDEEDTIDNLVRQLTELDRPAALSTSTDPDATPTPSRPPSPSPAPPPSQRPSSTTHHPENPNSTEDPLNTAFISGDCSMEAELQATYEALQEAREQQEAMQADLQQTVSQLQEREADLRGAELNLRAAHSALEKAHYDNHALVMEIAETRRTLEKSQEKVQEAWEDLRQARDTALLKETQLQEAEAKIQRLRHSRDRVIQGVSKARTLVSGSIDQVKAGERALHALSHAHLHDDYHAHTSLSPTDSPPTSTKNLDATCRTDSGLYSEDSERDDDPKTPDRSSDHISVSSSTASEDDLWTPRRPSGGDSTKDFKHLIRGGTGDSSSSSSPKSHFSLSPQPDNFTSELMIIEEGDLPQWKGSPSKEGDLTRWRGSSTKNSDLSKWNGASLSDTFISTSSSTAIIEGLEREVLWLQYTLDQAEKECEENISNLKLVEMETQLGDVKGEVGGQRDKFNSSSVGEHDRVSPLNSFVSSSSSSSSSASNSYQTPSSSSLLQKTASRGLNHPSRILPHSPECLEATLG